MTSPSVFTVWGVRFDDHSVGSAYGALVVTVDGVVDTAPRGVHSASTHTIAITATSERRLALRELN